MAFIHIIDPNQISQIKTIEHNSKSYSFNIETGLIINENIKDELDKQAINHFINDLKFIKMSQKEFKTHKKEIDINNEVVNISELDAEIEKRDNQITQLENSIDAKTLENIKNKERILFLENEVKKLQLELELSDEINKKSDIGKEVEEEVKKEVEEEAEKVNVKKTK